PVLDNPLISDTTNDYHTGSTVIVTSGESYTFTCTAGESRPESTITWYLGNTLMNANAPTTTSNGKLKTTIRSLTFIPERSNHNEQLKCTAGNDVTYPYKETYIVLDVYGVPKIPTAMTLIDRSYDILSISLSPGCDEGDGRDIVHYIEYRSALQASFQSWPSDGMGTRNTTILIVQLQPTTAYEIKAKTGNIYGIGQFSTIYVFFTYHEPIVNLNDQTGIIKWTRHEDTKYECVKIEKLDRDDNWSIEENCLDRGVVEYTVKNNKAEYRVTYCTRDNTCEGHHFKAIKNNGYQNADCVECSYTAAISISVLVSLLGGGVIGFLIGFILIKRLTKKRAKQVKQNNCINNTQYRYSYSTYKL
ncbi:uncharacterized protein LOC144342945, partial [Saccoglossus kowalevskii]